MTTPVISSFEADDDMPVTAPEIRVLITEKNNEVSTPVAAVDTGKFFMPGAAFTIIIILLLGFSTIKIMDPETLPVRNVGVVGEFAHVSPTGLQDRVSKVVRGGFFSVNVEKIQESLLLEPWIRDVSVKRVWPDRLTVTIKEQTAVAQWGEDALLNSEAEVFRPDMASFPASLPVLTGPENTSRLVLDHYAQLLEILPEGVTIQHLSLSNRRSWELELNTGPVIRLGKSEVIPRMQRFLEYLPTNGVSGLEQIQYIDMRYTNGFALLRKPETNDDLKSTQDNYGKEI